jgi:hypothetical protein
MPGLQALQFVHQPVEFLVGNGRRIHDVIQVLVAPEFRAQLLDALSIVVGVAL